MLPVSMLSSKQLSPLHIPYESNTLEICMNGEGTAFRACLSVLQEDQCSALVVNCHEWFHPLEWRRINRLTGEKRKMEYILGRGACKLALSILLQHSNVADLIIESGVFGQPVLNFFSDQHPELSISHTDGLAAALVADRGCPIAIDVEKLNGRSVDHLSYGITESDLQQFSQIQFSIDHIYLRAWTIKEALSKVLRCGITAPFSLFDIQSIIFLDQHTLQCRYKNFPQYNCYSWKIDDYLLAMVTPRNVTFNFGTHQLQAILQCIV